MNVLPRLLWTWMLASALTLLLALQAQAQAPFKPVPPYRARVTDEAGMLTAGQRQQLEGVLADYETRTGSQIAVLLVASTAPEVIEQYSIRVADAWKLGRKGVDDGVLLLVARDNPKDLRRLRIEAGRGVQGVLTDAQSKRILQDTIAPHFRQNDWYGGLVAGVGAISALLDQEKFPAPQQHAPAAQDDDGGPGIVVSLFLIIVGILLIRSLFRGQRGRLAQPGVGNTTVDSGWNDAATGVILGSALRDDDERRRGGSMFSDSSSSDSGSSFDGGGGGSFDGGGASGDW